MWVATKWDFILLFFFFLWGGGGGGHVWPTLRLRLRLGIVSGVGYTQIKCVWDMHDTYIFRKGCVAK